jgi:nucleoside 2-deoxyribosyltransferase
MKLQMIMPVESDPKFSSKKAIINGIAVRRGLKVEFPTEWQQASLEGQAQSFNVARGLAELGSADFIIADLSLERPSCYYELGLAQSLGKQVFLVAEEGTTIHQAAGRSDTRYYRGLDEYRDVIHSIAKQLI